MQRLQICGATCHEDREGQRGVIHREKGREEVVGGNEEKQKKRRQHEDREGQRGVRGVWSLSASSSAYFSSSSSSSISFSSPSTSLSPYTKRPTTQKRSSASSSSSSSSLRANLELVQPKKEVRNGYCRNLSAFACHPSIPFLLLPSLFSFFCCTWTTCRRSLTYGTTLTSLSLSVRDSGLNPNPPYTLHHHPLARLLPPLALPSRLRSPTCLRPVCAAGKPNRRTSARHSLLQCIWIRMNTLLVRLDGWSPTSVLLFSVLLLFDVRLPFVTDLDRRSRYTPS